MGEVEEKPILKEEELENLPIIILAEGPFNSRNIVTHQTNQTIRHTPELDQYIEQVWQEEVVRRPPHKLYDSPKVLVHRIWQEGEILHLETGRTTFKEALATQSSEVARKFGKEAVAVTLGVTGIIKTADNKLILGQQMYYRKKAGGIHVIGGLVEPTDQTGNILDLQKGMTREIEEEVGLGSNDWQLKEYLGVVQGKEEPHVDILFLAETNKTEEEVRQLSSDREIEIKFINNTPNQVSKTLLHFLKTASDQSIGALYLYGKGEFGVDWANYAKQRMVRRTKIYQKITDEQGERAKRKIEVRVSRL